MYLYIPFNLMSSYELAATLALPKLPRIGCTTARKLIRHFGSALEVFQRIDQSNNSRWKALKTIFTKPETAAVLRAAEKECSYIEKHQIQWIDLREPTFPTALNQCPDAPLVLFYSGQPFPTTTRVISIVGTRQPSQKGRAFTAQLVEQLSPYNPIIVSGFAYGIDIEAQLAANEHGLQAYACLGHGILGCYPKQHRKYRKEIEQSGGFLSEYWPNEPFNRTNFLQRNRIIAGLAQATVVVESRAKGGALTTAYYALGYQRDVFAVPGRPDDRAVAGCLDLIKNRRAECLTSGADLAEALGWTQQKQKPQQPELLVTLNEHEQKVLQYLGPEPKHIDLIAIEAQVKVSELASMLFLLEMKGVVSALAGKMFKRV